MKDSDLLVLIVNELVLNTVLHIDCVNGEKWNTNTDKQSDT